MHARTPQQQAELLALELEAGLTSLANVVDWAFDQIASSPRPAGPLLDLTSSKLHPTDVVHLLRVFSGAPRDENTLRLVLQSLAAALRAKPDNDVLVARTLWHMSHDQRWPLQLEGLLCSLGSYDAQLDDAMAGIYGDRAEIAAEMLADLDAASTSPDAA